MTLSLYDQDILLWVEDTVAKLKAGNFHDLDIVNLIQEVEALGSSQKRELLSRLIVLIEHLLKRLYVNSPYDYHGWERAIRTQRTELDILISQVPSLKSLWNETFQEAWQRALKNVTNEYKSVNFPNQWTHSWDLAIFLSSNFWE
jgi:hypothetical protein